MNVIVLRQLARIKGFYLYAARLAEKKDEINLVLTIQLLDFIIESFLKTVVFNFPSPQDYKPPAKGYFNKVKELPNNPDSKKFDFKRTWDEVIGIIRESRNKIKISDLPYRRDIISLHELRNSIQHELRLPHHEETNKYLIIVGSFLLDNYKDVFDQDFNTLSLLDIIQNQQIKYFIRSAYNALESNDIDTAISESAYVLRTLYNFAEKMSRKEHYSDYLLFETSIQRAFVNSSGSGSSFHSDDTNDIVRLIGTMISDIREQKAYIILNNFGYDYGLYIKIKKDLPFVLEYSDGSRETVKIKSFTIAEAKNIVGFVEEQAIILQTSGFFELAETIKD